MPWLDRWLGKNAWCPIKFATFDGAAYYSFQRSMERQALPEKQKHGDFLDNFLEAKETHPDIVTDNEVVSYIMMNVLAGADTTAIVQKAIAYHILRNPAVQERLVAELDAAGLSFPAQYEETRDLPYLNAVVKEGMRMHPVIGGILERVVPAGGLTLADGRVIAPGTKVGINPWVLTRNTDIYGADADVFRPERWLRAEGEAEEVYEARVKAMRDIDFTFGAGRRVCVGSNVATVEIHKLTATLFSRYDVSDTRLGYRRRRRADNRDRLLSTPTTASGRRGGGGSLSSTTSRSRSSVGRKACKGWSVIGYVTCLFVVQSNRPRHKRNVRHVVSYQTHQNPPPTRTPLRSSRYQT